MQQNKLITYSLVAALAGFIFGFDTVVISGANQPIKELWQTSPLFHGFFIMSMALWGTVFGAAFGGVPAQKMGRKKTLIWIGILFTVSALGTALAPDPYSFSFFRFLGGLGIGASSVVAPTYISEISTAKSRGRLTALYQFNIVFGILVAFLSNYFLQGFDGANDWRWMLGVLALPSLVYTLLVFIVPESPRWLVVTKNDVAAAKIIFPLIGETNPDEAINNMLADSQNNTQQKSENILTAPKYKKVIGLSFLLAFFNQLSGINFILYYAPEILEKAGLATKESLSSSIAIGGINLLFTFVGIYLIDRLGRRQLLIIGSIGYILSLALVGWCFQTSANPSLLLSFLLLFIASHAIGQGAVIWVFIAEIFPTRVRAWGQSFGCSVHWVFAAIITLVTPIFLDETDGIYKDNPYPIFYFFALMMMLQLLWVLLKVQETKGVSLEDLEKKLVG